MAQGDNPAPPRQLENLTPSDAEKLVSTLKLAQQQIKAGDKLYFELLSGAPASYAETEIAPREAFLDVSFDDAWRLERIESRNLLWQPYKLVVPVNGLGKPMWYIEVVLGSGGKIARVEMLWKAPPPF